MSTNSEIIRKKFSETDAKRDEGLSTPVDIIRYDDIQYGEDPLWQKLDVYKLKDKQSGRVPLIISVHGGGWVYGDKERYQFYCMRLAQMSGFAVVNFTYRLAPENKFPAPLEDTCLVLKWVLDNADKYGFDINNIFAVGDSAGANILSLVCAMCVNEDYRNRFNFYPPKDFNFNAIALNCGVNIINNDPKDNFTINLLKDYLVNGGSDEEIYLLNMSNHLNENYPPVYLLSAEKDFLRLQMLPIAEKLLENNIEFETHYFKDNLGHVFHLDIRSDIAEKCNRQQISFFNNHLK